MSVWGGFVFVNLDPAAEPLPAALDQTQRLHELLPVHGAQETKTGNTVADGNLVGSLSLFQGEIGSHMQESMQPAIQRGNTIQG